MALTSAQYVRLRVQDQPIRADSTYNGDGTALSFALPHRNLVSASAYIPGANGWSSTGATFNVSGWVDFSGAISANSAWRAVYIHSTFSDDEVDEFIARGGTIAGAAQEAVRTLMFDGLKRASWSAPDGSSYDDTAAMSLLRDMDKALSDELQAESIAGGSVISWGLEQENY